MLDELLILKKIKGGDIKAFEELFRRYYFPLCCYAAGITGQVGAAGLHHRLVINLCSIANTRKFGTDTVKLY